jgi:beta-phosphoglucomutase
MDWINHYQLFLFDFDGILVNTEELHYKAYMKVCADRGFSLKWDHATYMSYALYSATAVQEGIYRDLPELFAQESNWDMLYREKKKVYADLLHSEGPGLMPGVAELLKALEKAGIARCVVTHSPEEHITKIRKQHPILNTIPLWITREYYSQPKPAPECYQKAIALLKNPGDRIIGFEDSPRGLKALLGTEAKGVLISDLFSSHELQKISADIGKPFSHFPSFTEMFNSPPVR